MPVVHVDWTVTVQEWRLSFISAQRSRSQLRWPVLVLPSRAVASWIDLGVAAGVTLVALIVYIQTLLPGLGNRDTAEFQWVVPTLGLAHPTGYPLYTLLGWLWSQLPLGGTPAWRLNLFSAATAALGVGVLYMAARAIGQMRTVASAVALVLALSRAFWSQATIAEVYGLAGLLQALLLLALLRWRAGRWPMWPIGLFVGLGLAHHRTVVLMLPGVVLFFVLASLTAKSAKSAKIIEKNVALRSSRFARGWPDSGWTMLALMAGCLLYLYVPLRAPDWMRTWEQVWAHISGAELSGRFFDPARLRAEGLARPLDLARRFVVPQFGVPGLALVLLGAARVLRRDRALAALLIVGYGMVCGFCAAYYVDDVEVFFIPAHLLAALLLGEGAIVVVESVARQVRRVTIIQNQEPRTKNRLQLSDSWFSVLGSWSAWPLFLIPAFLLWANLAAIRAANTDADDQAARSIMAQPLSQGALVIGDWYATEGLRYLQALEGLRPDLQLSPAVGRDTILAALAHGRRVYLIKPDLALGLTQVPHGPLWEVGSAPLATVAIADLRWEDGMRLSGYTLPQDAYAPGSVVPVTLQWEAYAAPHADYIMFVHLIGPDGTIWGQADAPPAGAPTQQWRAGDRAIELAAPKLKPDAPPGHYHVTLGWYDVASGRRPALLSGDDYVTLGKIEVRPVR